MKNNLRKKMLITLAAIALLFSVTMTSASSLQEAEMRAAHASLSLRTAAEVHNFDHVEGDAIVSPSASTEIGDTKLSYAGTFRKTADSEGNRSDLQTFVHKAGIETEDWRFEAGRTSLREFGGVKTVDSFDNDMSAKGMSRNFTGVFASHRPSHLTLAVGSSDGTMSPSHWDMLTGSWHHRFGDKVGVQIHGSATKDHLEKAGLAVEVRPTDRLSLLADGVYTRNSTAAMLLANMKASDRVKLFAGAEITAPCDSTATGKVIAGVEGNLGHGFHAVGAVNQDFSFGHGGEETTAILGLRFNTDRTLF